MIFPKLVDPKYGSKVTMKGILCLRPQGRTSCLKIGVFLSLLWLFGFVIYVYVFKFVSSYNSELLNEFKKEDMNIQKLQQKISDLIAKGFANDNHEQLERIVEDQDETKEVVEQDDGITPEAYKYMRELGLINPGENGAPVELSKNLSEDFQKLIKNGYETHGYNAFLSSMIRINRHIPDVRSDVCKNKTYSNLPKCSIVIPFHNEDWMLLMRTVHSVLNRSPHELIEEILLVDDASSREYLHDHLDQYIKKYPKIRIVRSYRRLGIISNRMLGAVNAIGPVIVNIDSHVEVTTGWLEPLLDRFAKDMNILVWPKVSSVNSDTLQLYLDNKDPGSIGGFAWNMDFNWIDIKWYEGDHPTEMWEPKRSPTVIGALHAISKEFFNRLGMLDPDFDIWGGEDVELSFKVWMCGGKVEYVPCSFVAHMYKGHTYTFPNTGKGGYRWNTDRIAEIWLDEYKRYYYRSVGDTKDRKFGDVSERIEIRKKLGCKSFKWFIENVYPIVPIPENLRDPLPNPVEEKQSNGTR